MEREIDCRAGYKHHLTKGYLEYLQAEVMKMCEQLGLHQVDLLSPAKTRISDKEYRAKQRGQKTLDGLNEQITVARMKPAVTVFQTQKQFLRDAIMDIASKAATVEEFIPLLKEKYGIEVKERRDRFSYLHSKRSKYITGCALGSDFEKEHGYDTREALLRCQTEVSEKLDAASSSLQEAEAKLKEINERIHYTGQYYASRPIE